MASKLGWSNNLSSLAVSKVPSNTRSLNCVIPLTQRQIDPASMPSILESVGKYREFHRATAISLAHLYRRPSLYLCVSGDWLRLKHLCTTVGVCSRLHFVTNALARLAAGNTLQFTATVSNVDSDAVAWAVHSAASGEPRTIGSIDSTGLYTAPVSLVSQITLTVTATSTADRRITASVPLTVDPATITVSPEAVNVLAKRTVAFTASLSNPSMGAIQWLVDGTLGGNATSGTITAAGVYTAPGINPGNSLVIPAVSSTGWGVTGNAKVTITNPPPPVMTGITYDKLLSSWNHTQLPWIHALSGLELDANALRVG